jgi:HSP20 family molecular chaperone IbpA
MVRMNIDQQLFDETPLRRFEYDDGVVLAADVGAGEDTSVDVVDDTVILVAGDEQYEQALPEESDARAFINNGVLTIELEEDDSR